MVLLEMFGRQVTLAELRSLVGDLGQLAGVTPVEYVAGRARGVRGLQVRTGALRFTVLLDRGMDLVEVESGLLPFGFSTGAGFVHPAYYDPRGTEWLRTYAGGFLTMGGLSQMGEPCEDGGEEFGLHGRIALTPAEETGYRVDWERGAIEIWGRVREIKPLTTHLELERRITVGIGSSVLRISDTVTNRGRRAEPHMMLYHANFGYPLLDSGSRFVAPAVATEGWDALSESRKADGFTVPGLRDEEYVFHHRLASRDDLATAALVNPALHGGAFACLRYHPSELPHLWQWLSLVPGSFVMGIEPGNSHIGGRATARAKGDLPVLAPGEASSYSLEFECGAGPDGMARILAEISAQRGAGA